MEFLLVGIDQHGSTNRTEHAHQTNPGDDLALDVYGLSVSLGGSGGQSVEIFRDVSFQLKKGNTIALLGRSGTGKTTLLNCIAGFVPTTAGRSRFPQSKDSFRPPFAYVFQEDRLLPWRTAAANVQIAFERLHVPSRERRAKAFAALDRVGLSKASEKYPSQLSGGMRSRVALARALALEAPLLLLDEPFSKLDPSTREEMHDLLLSLQSELGFASLLVTHDAAEAVRLSNSALIINAAGLGTMEKIPIDRSDPNMTGFLLKRLNRATNSQTDNSALLSATAISSAAPVSRRAILSGGLGTAIGLFGNKRTMAQAAPLRVGVWATGIQLALIELIEAKGLFKKHGLNYELVRFADVNGNTLALATDRIDVAFSVSCAGALDLAANKRAIKIILATQVADGQLATKSPELKQAADLKGRMIGMAPAGSAGAAYTKAFLSRSYSLEPNSYRIAGGGEARLCQLLVQGEIDAALLREVTYVQLAERLGLHSLADQRAEWGKIAGQGSIPPLGVGVARDQILQSRRSEAVDFISAIVDGIRIGTTSPEFVTDLMANSLKLKPEEAKAYADTWAVSFNGKFEDADVASLEAAQRLFIQEGSLKVAADKSSFDQSVYRDALAKL